MYFMILIKILDKYNIPREVDNREEIENILENVLNKDLNKTFSMKKKITKEIIRLKKENKSSKTKPETITDNKQIIKDNDLKWDALEY